MQSILGPSGSVPGFRFSEEYDGWWMTTRYKALLHYAGANFVPPGSRIVTGIPLHIFGSQRPSTKSATSSGKRSKAPAVAVLPQGFGALCLAISTNSALAQGRVALVDIGSRTTELICFSDGQYLNHESAGVVLGVGQVYTQVAQKLSSQHQRQIDAYEVDWALREDKPIKIKGVGRAAGLRDDGSALCAAVGYQASQRDDTTVEGRCTRHRSFALLWRRISSARSPSRPLPRRLHDSAGESVHQCGHYPGIHPPHQYRSDTRAGSGAEDTHRVTRLHRRPRMPRVTVYFSEKSAEDMRLFRWLVRLPPYQRSRHFK